MAPPVGAPAVAPVVFVYPGDDPAQLTTAAGQLDLAAARIDRLGDALRLSRAALKASWITQATDLADADLGVLVDGLPAVRTALTTAREALTTHHGTLVRIRARVDELQAEYRRQQRLYDEAEDTFASYTGRLDGAADAGRQQARQVGSAAVTAQNGLVAEYQTLVTEANTSAQTCADAVTTSWDPQMRSRAACLTDPGAMLLGQGGISVESLNMLRIQADVTEAARATRALLATTTSDPTDPAYQQALARLAEIWGENEGSGIFAEEFYADIGAGPTVELFARVATAIQPEMYGDPGDLGPLNAEFVRALQQRMGDGLALATRDIALAPDGSLRDVADGGLGVGWMQDLRAAGRADLSIPWGLNPITVTGYVPLMATVANGSGFSAGFLQATGDDMAAMEREVGGGTGGEHVWLPNLDTPVRWNWSSGAGWDFPRGTDPFTSWTAAMTASPGASVHVLARDRGLLDYLLNERSWGLRDSGDWSGPSATWYGMTGDREMLEGLQSFGDALPQIIGPGALGADNRTAFASVVELLGSREFNARIDAGEFQDADWVPPELRPGLGSLLLVNMDSVHDAMSDTTGAEHYARVLAEAAKSGGFADRAVAAEALMIDHLAADGAVGSSDIDAQARIAATVAHGQNAADIGMQQDADAAHNARVDGIAAGVQLLIDTGATMTGPLEAPIQFFGGGAVDLIAGDFHQDTGLQTRNENADWTWSFREQLDDTVAQQAFERAYPALRDPPAGVQLLDPSGAVLPWAGLDGHAKLWVEQQWTAALGAEPGDAGSSAVTAFDANMGFLKSVGITYADGT